jgi:hypothetical protein
VPLSLQKSSNGVPSSTIDGWNDPELNRMVREKYFTTLAKLGPGKEGSFTSVLISRVCLVKKNTQVFRAQYAIGKMIKNEE